MFQAKHVLRPVNFRPLGSGTLHLLAKRKMELIQSFLPIPIFFYLVMVYYE